MKKILKTLIVSIAVMVSFATPSSAEQTSDNSLLSAVGVSIAADSSDTVTRGEAANFLSQITGLISPEGNLYSDADKTHPYYRAINNVSNLGVMNGDANGKFYPDDEISGKDFLISIVRLAGFSDYAEAAGGIKGYVSIAAKYKLFPKEIKLDGPITCSQAAEILSDVVQMQYCDAVGFTEKGGNYRIDYAIDKKYTVLEHYRSIVKLDGVIVSVGDISLKGCKESGAGTIGINTGDNITYYKTNLTGAETYLGCRAYCWYDKNSEEIIFAEPRDKIETLTLGYKDIESISSDRTRIRYFAGNKSKEIRLPYDVTFVYNGSNCGGLTVDELHKPNVYLTVVDVDDDEVFEVVFAEEYETVVVGSYVAEKQTVSDRRNGKTYYLSSEDFENGTRFFSNGTEVDFKYIHRGSVLTILTDKESTKRTVYIGEATAGRVEEVDESDGRLKIDGVYRDVLFELENSDISPGDYVSLYPNHYGCFSDYEKAAPPGGEYAYLIDIAEEGKLSSKVKCKYVSVSGKIVIGELDKNFTVNSVRSDYGKLSSALLAGGRIHQLVYISFNGEKIKNIDISNVAEGFPVNDSYEKFTLNYSAQAGECLVYESTVNARFYVPSTTPTFYIPVDDYGKVYDDEVVADDFENVGILSGTKPEIKIYDSTFSRLPGAIVVYGIAGKETNYLSSGRLKDTNAFVIEKISNKLYDDGEIRPCIKGMILGMPKEMYPADYLDISELKPGDVIKMGSYRGNELRSYERMFTLKRNKKDAASVLSRDGVYSDETLAYNAAGTMSKTFSGGIYGTVEEMGTTLAVTSVSHQNIRDPKYSVVVRPQGSADDSNLLTLPVTSWLNTDDTGTYVYLYNEVNDTAYAISPMDIELTGKTVYCFTYNGLTKAIVVYEGGDT